VEGDETLQQAWILVDFGTKQASGGTSRHDFHDECLRVGDDDAVLAEWLNVKLGARRFHLSLEQLLYFGGDVRAEESNVGRELGFQENCVDRKVEDVGAERQIQRQNQTNGLVEIQELVWRAVELLGELSRNQDELVAHQIQDEPFRKLFRAFVQISF